MDSESGSKTSRGPENDASYEQISRLPAKGSATIRFFDRDAGLITVYNDDAEMLAKKFFHSNGVIKHWGSVIYINLSLNNFEAVLKEALLSWHYRVELYVRQNGVWTLNKKASPGNLTHFEDDVFAVDLDASSKSGESDVSSCFVSIRMSSSSSEGGAGGGLLIGLAFVDVIMREISLVEFADSPHLYQLETMLFRKGPKEAIIEKGLMDEFVSGVLERARVLVSEVPKKSFDASSLVQDLNTILISKKNHPVNSAALPELELEQACKALSAAIKYLDLVSQFQSGGQFTLCALKEINYMRLDCSAIKALHLLPDPLEGVTKEKCLSGLLNKCRTGQGQRLLRQYLRQPLTDVRLIEERLDCVSLLVSHSDVRRKLHDSLLRRIPDVQRVTARFQKKKASLKEVYKVFCGVEVLPEIISVLESQPDVAQQSSFTEKFLQPLKDVAKDLSKFVEMVTKVLDFSKVDEGKFLINSQLSESLQEVSAEMQHIRRRIDDALASVARHMGREPEKGVKIENHPTHGYCFRVTTKDDKLVRDSKEFTWLDSKKDGIRFTNQSMMHLSEEYEAKAKMYNELQREMVDKVVDITIGYLEPFSRMSSLIAELDVLTGFAVVVSTAKSPFVRPKILPAGHEIKAKGLRHPCVENEDNVHFIPNDVTLSRKDEQFIVITGPNMGGKSTFIRSVGILCLLAQVGCYVPCDEAQVSVVDAIMARIGAGDQLEKGVSTFMAEMMETNVILNTATENSLVIVDELGRGTSTFDGFGLAFAISEHIISNIGCFCLFATHFHEITDLANKFDCVKNYHFTATVENSEVIMMYKMRHGICDRSFGIHVAKMVKFPEDVLEKAESYASELEWPNLMPEDDKVIHDFLEKLEQLTKGLDQTERLKVAQKMLDELLEKEPQSKVARMVKDLWA